MQWLGNYKECINASLIPGVKDTRRRINSHYCPAAFGVPLVVCILVYGVFDLTIIWFIFSILFLFIYCFIQYRFGELSYLQQL